MQNIEYTPERCEEMMRCMDDPVYFIETYAIRAQLTEYQREVVAGLMSGHVITKGPRQNGKTTVMWAFMLWYATFSYDKTIAMVYSKSIKQDHVRREFLEAYGNLPHWLRPEIQTQSKDSIRFGNGNFLIYRLASPNALRGMTISLAVFPDFDGIDGRLQEEIWCGFVPTIIPRGTVLMMSDGMAERESVFTKIWDSCGEANHSFVAVQGH